MIHGEAYPCGITLLAATTLAQELIEGVGEDDNYRLFVKVRKVRSAASIRSRDLGTRLRVLPVLLAVRQLSPAGLHSPWLDAVCQYTLSRFGPQLRPPFLRSTPKRSCIACLPPCVRRPAATGPVRRRRVVPATRADYQRGFVESYPASRRVVVILSLPRSPCSARRSDTFLILGPWTRPDPRQLCKTPPWEESRARPG